GEDVASMATDSPELARIAAEALDMAKSAGQPPTTTHLLLATFTVPGAADVLLRERGCDEDRVLDELSRTRPSETPELFAQALEVPRGPSIPPASRPASTPTSPSTVTSNSTPTSTSKSTPTSTPTPALPPISVSISGPAPETTSQWSLDPRQFPYLCTHGRNLSALAALGQLDPALGREAEVEELLDILGKRRANNPVLVGEPGVGETAIVEGLAQRLSALRAG